MLATSCGDKEPIRLAYPPASAFKQEPAPTLDPSVVINDDEEGFRQYQQDKNEWGARGWQALGRVCLWFKDQGASLECD